MSNGILTQKRLKEVIHYNLDTGIFTWIRRHGLNSMYGKAAGTNHNRGYRSIGVDGKIYLAHRLAWLYVNGYFPKQVDHIDHNRSNNKYINLRCANASINSKNRSKTSRNTSSVVGVYWCKLNKKWRARITFNRKCIQLGLFKDIKDAQKARECAKVKYDFHKNHG